jgi:outer membrane murein-binding lipoprotein Lpp
MGKISMAVFLALVFISETFAQYYVYDPAVEHATYTVQGQIIEGDKAKLNRMDYQISQLNDQLNRLSSILDTGRKTSGDVDLIKDRSGDPASIQKAVNTKLLDVKKDVPIENPLAGEEKPEDFLASVDRLLEEYKSIGGETSDRKAALAAEVKNLGERVNAARTDAEVQKATAALSAVNSVILAEQNRERQAMNRLIGGYIRVENEKGKREEEERKVIGRTLNADSSKGVMDSGKAKELLGKF